MRLSAMIILTATVIVLTGCGTQGGKKNSGSDSPPGDTAPDSGGSGDVPEKQQGDPQPTETPPPAKTPASPKSPAPAPVTPPPADPAPPASKYGQHVEADLVSIQTRLVDHYCLPCHQGAEAPGGLDLNDIGVFASGVAGAGGYRGIFIYPGRPEISAFKLVLEDHAGEQVMPPVENGLGIPMVLPQQIAAVTEWIGGLAGGSDPGRP